MEFGISAGRYVTERRVYTGRRLRPKIPTER
jgi:hypothetical protein